VSADPNDTAAVLDSYREAVTTIEALSSQIDDWAMITPCAPWRAEDLAGHLVAIIAYYHRLLDAATASDPLVDLPRGADLAAMNAADLASLAERSGPERVARYVTRARSHVARLEMVDHSLVLGVWSGLGPMTIAQHSAVAIGEWHVHAWDLARAARTDHRPSDPDLVAAGQAVLGRPVGAGASWEAVLAAYGRDPQWCTPRPGA